MALSLSLLFVRKKHKILLANHFQQISFNDTVTSRSLGVNLPWAVSWAQVWSTRNRPETRAAVERATLLPSLALVKSSFVDFLREKSYALKDADLSVLVCSWFIIRVVSVFILIVFNVFCFVFGSLETSFLVWFLLRCKYGVAFVCRKGLRFDLKLFMNLIDRLVDDLIDLFRALELS